MQARDVVAFSGGCRTGPIRSILVAADASPASHNAVRYAIDIARHYDAKLHLVHVVSPLRYGFEGAELIQQATQTATRGIDDFQIRLACIGALKGIRSRFSVREGEVAREIEEFANQENVDLIVVGTNCPKGISYLVRGSAGERIFRSTKRPVLTVSVSTSGPALKKEVQEILFATDFRRGSIAAFPYAVSLAEQFGARLTVLHVLDSQRERWVRGEPSPLDASLQRLRDMPLSENLSRTDIRFTVESGDVADVILCTARTQSASVIVMGLTRTWLFARAVHPPSIAYRVVCDAPCPVLTVRA